MMWDYITSLERGYPLTADARLKIADVLRDVVRAKDYAERCAMRNELMQEIAALRSELAHAHLVEKHLRDEAVELRRQLEGPSPVF